MAALSWHGSDRLAVGVRLRDLSLDRVFVEAKVTSGGKNAPRIGGMRVVGEITDLVALLQLLEIAEELDKKFLFHHAEVAEQVASHSVPARAPNKVAPVLGQMIKEDPQFTPIHQLERKVMNMVVAFVQESENMVVSVDVQPHAFISDPVGHLKVENFDVPLHQALDVAGEEIHVPQFARMQPRDAI